MPPGQPPPESAAARRWLHALAWALAVAVFPLVFLGGLVTTYEAGMSVEDWPTTYGHWFYPIQQWFRAAWDTFLEHGHRVWAQVVGVLASALALLLCCYDRRRAMRWVALALFLGVCLQGTLGGLRVLFDARLLAKVHGCTAAAYFALCAATVALTAPKWRDLPPPQSQPAARRLQRLALAAATLLYLDIIFGAQLRHAAATTDAPGWFTLWVWLKLIVAALAAAATVATWQTAARSAAVPLLARRGRLLATIVAVQLALGAATWVVNYGWPAWFTGLIWAVEYTVVAQGRLQVLTTTAHVAVGSLALAMAVNLALWSHRLLRGPRP